MLYMYVLEIDYKEQMQYLLPILHLSCKFNVCLVTKPWSVLLRNKMAERFASVSEDELCEKFIIKQ